MDESKIYVIILVAVVVIGVVGYLMSKTNDNGEK